MCRLLLVVLNFAIAGGVMAQSQGQDTYSVSESSAQLASASVEFSSSFRQAPWFADRTIRAQIGITEQQFDRLKRAYEVAWSNYHQSVNNLASDMESEQRSSHLRDLQNQFDRTVRDNAKEILTDPHVRRRFDELSLQFRSYDAFNDPIVQQRLDLSLDQRQRIERQRQIWISNLSQWNRGFKADRVGVVKRFNQWCASNRDQIDSVLTPTQKRTWLQMTGEVHDFLPSAYFPPTIRR